MADERHDDDEYALSDEQKAAVAELSRSNVYVKQSKWKTLHELPTAEKWPYFKENFLSYTVIIAIVVVIIAAFGISYLTKGPNPELSVEGINMGGYADQLDRLGSDFVKTEKISDSRLVQMDTSISIGDSENAQDGSARLLTMVSSGQINMIVTDADTFAEVNGRGDITKPAEVMDEAQLERVKDSLVDAKGDPVTDVKKAVGFDLSKSKVWKSVKGLPQKQMIIGFSNVTKSKDMPIRFIEYLRFE
ncbi:hypothetical protein [Bifidobacterium moukalabense]|uniref:hypothetical protein n=1 Tax=Bifidobacterium moukalabense TaxID=1333651 RepID=UPI001485022B|nr:hypothetical protein [Bifidobacterium moukalabense]